LTIFKSQPKKCKKHDFWVFFYMFISIFLHEKILTILIDTIKNHAKNALTITINFLTRDFFHLKIGHHVYEIPSFMIIITT